MFRPIIGALLLALLSTACTSHPLQQVTGLPSLKPGASKKNVWAEASFLSDHASVFGTDLVSSYGIVPVALKMGYQGGDAPRAYLPDMEMRLFLSDGTALKFRAYDDLPVPADVQERIVEQAFQKIVLDPWDEAKHSQAFVFFELPLGTEFEALSGTRVRHLSEPLWRDLELADSLLSFVYTDDEGKWPVNVGLQQARS